LIDETDNIKLRYKRVSQFNVLDSKQGYLIDLINLQTPRESIIQSFATSFNVTLEEIELFIKNQMNSEIKFTKIAEAREFRETIQLKTSDITLKNPNEINLPKSLF
jgi:hypothetical protein